MNIIDKEYSKIGHNKFANLGLMAMVTIGLHFNYYLKEGDKIL